MLIPAERKSSSVIDRIETEQYIILKSDYMNMRITPTADNIMRVTVTRCDTFKQTKSYGVDVIPRNVNWKSCEDEKNIYLSTDILTAAVCKADCSIKYYNKSGELLFSETRHELEEYDALAPLNKNLDDIQYVDTPDGRKPVVEDAKRVFYKKLYKTKMSFLFNESEAVYGFGQYTEGKLNIRNTTRYIHHANMQIAMPLMVSTNGYGILFDMYCPMIFEENESGAYLFSEGTEEMDFYFISGKPNDVIAGYRYLSGKASLLPRWAYGYIQSQERYETQDELIDVLKEYRKRKLGIDCIVLDWKSWHGSNWGEKNLDKERFPDPGQMMKDIHSMNANLMVSIWSNMSGGDNYEEMKKENLFLPNCTNYNAFSEKAREIYWRQTEEGLFSYGIDAFWCDASEPFSPEWGKEIAPPGAVAYSDYVSAVQNSITIDKANAYSLFHSKSVYDGMRKSSSDKRVFNLTRSGYTGQQKYGTVLWSGDISASWDTFKRQIAEGLSMSASGFPWWTLDIGGFFVKRGKQWHWDGNYEYGNEDLGYRELYTRWYQYGSFLPIFRAHGTDTRREMWQFGDKGDLFYDTLVKYNKLRYKLMPTIYSIAGSVWKNDSSFISPLSFAFTYDKATYNIKDQFMFGDSIMVCPVTEPMYYGVNSVLIEGKRKTRKVYLPAGVKWYDFYTNECYAGGQIIETDAPIDKIPLFVKSGGIVLTGEACEYAEQNKTSPITVNIYSGDDGYFELYEDSGNGYGYESGEYKITKIIWDNTNKTAKLPEDDSRFKLNVII